MVDCGFNQNLLCLWLPGGRAGASSASVLQERRRLSPLLQRRPTLLFPQPDQQVVP